MKNCVWVLGVILTICSCSKTMEEKSAPEILSYDLKMIYSQTDTLPDSVIFSGELRDDYSLKQQYVEVSPDSLVYDSLLRAFSYSKFSSLAGTKMKFYQKFLLVDSVHAKGKYKVRYEIWDRSDKTTTPLNLTFDYYPNLNK